MKNEDRANSAPDLTPIISEHYDDSGLDGVAAPIKLLLKLIQDHKDAGKNDSRRMLRVATMMTILDTVRTRIQKCESFGNKRAESSLRRCNTDLRLNQPPPKDKKLSGAEAGAGADEKDKLRRELSACTAARKRLEMMCSSLGKEKEIMAAELSRKVHELCEMEQHVHDLKAQNERLVRRVQQCVGGSETQGNEALQEENRLLKELLVKSHQRYRSMKKKLQEAREENTMVCREIDEVREKIESSTSMLRRVKDCVGDANEDVESLESMFENFQTMLAKHQDTRWNQL